MIICVCNCIRERDIRCAARRGLTDVEQIYEDLGAAPNCRQCMRFAEDIVREETRAAA